MPRRLPRRGRGPKSFLEWDAKKFPGGAEHALRKIKSAGMQGGIWVHRGYRSYVDRDLPQIGKRHPDWFVRTADGKIYQGGYGIWTLNTKNKDALDEMVRPLSRGLRYHICRFYSWAGESLPLTPRLRGLQSREPALLH
jgi:alpha-galactosidase